MRKNIAGQHIGGQLIDATTGAAFTGSVTCYVTGDAGTQAVGSVSSGACAHEGNGFHTYNPAQAETNYDHIGFTFIGTGAVPATVQVFTSFPQTVDNATNISAIKTKTDFLPSATAGAAGGVFIAGSNAATSITTALTANIIGNVTGNLSGSAGSVTADVGITQAGADKAWSTTTRVLTAGTNIVLAKGTGVTGFNDLSAAQVNTEADTAISDAALATAANLATLAGYVDTEVAAIKAKTDNLPADPADASDITASLTAIAGYIDTEVAAIKAKTDLIPASPAAVGDIPTAAAVADAVWDEIIAGHAGVGSTGAALAAAGGSGDPWATALPGAYGAGTAGQIVGDYLDVAVSTVGGGSLTASDIADEVETRTIAAVAVVNGLAANTITAAATAADFTTEIQSGLATGANLSTAQAAITGIKAKTDLIPASPAAVGDVPTAVQNADTLLNRDMSAVSDTNSRSPLNALRFVRNGFSISGSTLTVLKEDDATAAYTRDLTTNPSAEPVTGVS